MDILYIKKICELDNYYHSLGTKLFGDKMGTVDTEMCGDTW